jgi:DNA adenine methylase
LVFLNKHCFNGLYRVNAKGFFNVPYNNSRKPSIDPYNIRLASEALAKADILCGDFSKAVEGAGTGDFVFLDSPYAPLNDTTFEAYTKEGFLEEEHRKLADLFRELDARGCSVMLTNHNTELIRSLYEGHYIDTVSVKRGINSDASKKTGGEVIITNY